MRDEADQVTKRGADGGVRAVGRIAALLRALRDAGGRARVTRLTRELDMPRSSLSDLLRPLIAVQWIERRDDGWIALGPRLRSVGWGALGVPPMPDLDARLDRIARACQGVSYLCARDVGRTRILRVAWAGDLPGVRVREGDATPPNWTLAGRLMASDLTDQQLRYFLSAHARRIPGRPPRSLDDAIDEIGRMRGLAIVSAAGEPEYHVATVCAPIWRGNRIAAALVAISRVDREADCWAAMRSDQGGQADATPLPM